MAYSGHPGQIYIALGTKKVKVRGRLRKGVQQILYCTKSIGARF
jgi:hypothetical protein